MFIKLCTFSEHTGLGGLAVIEYSFDENSHVAARRVSPADDAEAQALTSRRFRKPHLKISIVT